MAGGIILYEHVDFGGRQKTIMGNVDFISDFNDLASSIKVDYTVNKVTLYEHANYQGRSLVLYGGDRLRNLVDSANFNDIISSVKFE
ncbi:Beta/Gamma crystallin [Seinonella peptonophila]|uniref:Beta/Gamma crystallin n=1 Tax=Seinonella peptonophila TaxID=112248 RepID=A0A1M4U9V7_9BACL|nr:beta/gamma crystallin-related protein [Seinonella peptonophila]SHE53552.1 Beta/Gamma crystallin [Seinonella peptonophila]